MLNDIESDDDIEGRSRFGEFFEGGGEDGDSPLLGEVGGLGGGFDAVVTPVGAKVFQKCTIEATDVKNASWLVVWRRGGVLFNRLADVIKAALVRIGVIFPVVTGGLFVTGEEFFFGDGGIFELEGAVGTAAEVEFEAVKVYGDASHLGGLGVDDGAEGIGVYCGTKGAGDGIRHEVRSEEGKTGISVIASLGWVRVCWGDGSAGLSRYSLSEGSGGAECLVGGGWGGAAVYGEDLAAFGGDGV